MEEVRIEELVKRISINKHNVTTYLYSVIYHPLKLMDGGASEYYFKQQGNLHKKYLAKGLEIEKYFEERWNDPEKDIQTQYDSMVAHIKYTNEEIIPEILNLKKFYTICLEHDIYFYDSDKGRTARARMGQALSSIDRVISSLSSLSLDQAAAKTHESFYLLEVIQTVFDPLPYEVKYKTAHLWFNIIINVDKEGFINNVLTNIAENIKRHAFTTGDFPKRKIWEKEIVFEFNESADNYRISISNNGSPYNGDLNKVFTYGYCYGDTKNSGIGMSSIMTFMRSIGGDVSFSSSEKGVTYILVLKK